MIIHFQHFFNVVKKIIGAKIITKMAAQKKIWLPTMALAKRNADLTNFVSYA